MNNSQRIILSVYLPFTLMLLVLDNIYPDQDFVRIIKYTVMITLFSTSLTAKKRFKEQKIMTLALFFVVIGDFFLVFSEVIMNLGNNGTLLGMAGFFCAYLCLIMVYRKNFKAGIKEIITGVPIIGVFAYVFFSLMRYVELPMLAATLVFGLVLCYMTWIAVCTIYRGFYSVKAAIIIAVSGVFMFICDMGVAYSLFYPMYSQAFTPWITNIVWAVYVPGWALLAVVINENNLMKRVC